MGVEIEVDGSFEGNNSVMRLAKTHADWNNSWQWKIANRWRCDELVRNNMCVYVGYIPVSPVNISWRNSCRLHPSISNHFSVSMPGRSVGPSQLGRDCYGVYVIRRLFSELQKHTGVPFNLYVTLSSDAVLIKWMDELFVTVFPKQSSH